MKSVKALTLGITLILLVLCFSVPLQGMEAKKLHPFGLIRTPLKVAMKYPKFDVSKIRFPAKLPSSVDLSSGLPPVGDQGYVGSCACWAAVYYWKSYAEAKEHNWSVSDPAHQFSASYIYNLINGGGDNGSIYPAIYELMKRVGAAPLTEFPNFTTDYLTLPDKEVMREALPYKVDGIELIFTRPDSEFPPFSTPLSEETMEAMKALLASGEPFVIGIPVYPSFSYYTGGVYEPLYGEEIAGFHGMLVYGYDDSVKAFKVRNSWGTEWGIKGDCLLSYDFMRYYVCEAWRFVDAINPQIKARLELEVDHGRIGDLIITVGKGSSWDRWSLLEIEGSYPDYYLSSGYQPDLRTHLELVMDVSSFLNLGGDWKLKVSDNLYGFSGKVRNAQVVVEAEGGDSALYLLEGTGEMDIEDLETAIGTFTESIPPQPNEPPVVNLSASPESGYAPLLVSFTADAQDPDGDEIIRYEWDFNGDGYTDMTTTEPSASWTYYYSGNYEATVKAYDSKEEWGSDSVTIVVSEDPSPPPPSPINPFGGCSTGVNPGKTFSNLFLLGLIPILIRLRRRWLDWKSRKG